MKQLLNLWNFDLSSMVMFVIIVTFVVITRSFHNKTSVVSALVLSGICLFSPLYVLSAHYLFSAHMVVHIIQLFCIGPLLLTAASPEAKLFRHLFGFLKRHPVAAWIAGIGIMWCWHVPLVFNSAMSAMHQSSFNFLSLIETMSLIFSGILFCAPIVHTNKEYRVDALSGVVYLFTACIGCSLLGLLITFAPAGTYQHFLSMHDGPGLNNVIVNQWGMTQSTDQQAAGLIMWVPCCLVYVTGAMYLLINWFKHKEPITYSKEL